MYYTDMNEIEQETRCSALQLIHSLLQGGRVTETRLDAALATVGLSVAKWSALRQLVEAGKALPLGQLAERLACVKSNVTQLVDRLAGEDLVRRAPDPADRRSILAELTPAGRQRYGVGLEVMEKFERGLLNEFTPDERLLLARLLTHLGAERPG